MSQAVAQAHAVIATRVDGFNIYPNQLRQKIGVVYGNPETTGRRHTRSSSMLVG